MSITEKIKAGYYFFEDKYYALLDKIEKAIPVYKIVDPIDKVFPSFILLLIAIAAIIIFLLWPFISPLIFGPGTFNAKIVVQDESNKAIEGVSIELSFLETERTGRTDANGIFTVEIPRQEVDANISVEKTGFVSQKGVSITLSSTTPKKITLKAAAPPAPKKYSVSIIDAETRAPVQAKVTAEFHCSGNVAAPQKAETYNGEINNILPNEKCVRLSADFSAEGYEDASLTFSSSRENEIVRMNKKTGSVKATVTDPTGPVAGAELILKRGDIEADTGTTYSSGDYVFENVAPGNYTVSATAEDGRSETSDAFDVQIDEIAEVEITLPAPIPVAEQKRIFIKVIDANSRLPVSGARIIVFTGTTNIDSYDTDSTGEYSHAADKTKTYSMAVSKDGYVKRIISAVPLKAIDDTNYTGIELSPMLPAPNQNYGQISVHVYDESSNNVKNAKVLLYKKTAPGLIINFPYDETKDDGNVFFTGLPAGDYNVKVSSGTSAKGEAETTVELGKTSIVNIKLILTEGSAEITVKDSSISTNPQLGGATVTFFDSTTNAVLSSCTTGLSGSSLGKCESAKIKAETKIYAKATMDGFLPGFSNPITIVGNLKATQTIKLVPDNAYPADAKIIVEWDSLCSDLSCLHQTNIIDFAPNELDKTYYAKINLVLPANAEYREIAQHLSVGQAIAQAEVPTTNWRIQILSVTVPKTGTKILSKCYNAAGLYDAPDNCVVSTNAKTAVLGWNSLERGVWPIILKVKVEKNPQGTEIEFRSKAKAKIAGEEMQSEELKKIFRIGEAFCPANGFGWTLALKDSAGSPVPIRGGNDLTELAIGGDYNLSYIVANCTANDYHADMNATNVLNSAGTVADVLKLKIGSSEGFGPITAFRNINFLKNSELSSTDFGNIKISPQNDAPMSTIWLELTNHANSEQLSKQVLNFNVPAEKEMEAIINGYLLIEPSMHIRGQVNEKGAVTITHIENAHVKILRSDRSVITGAGTHADTAANGVFWLTLTNAQVEGLDKIIIRIDKSGYKTLEKNIALVTDPVFLPVNQNYACIKINGTSVLGTDLSPAEIGLPIVPTDSFAEAAVTTVNCPEEMEIEFVPMDSQLQPIIYLVGHGRGTTMSQNDTKKLAIGSVEGAEGEFPVLVKAKLESEPAKVAVAKIFAKFGKAGNGCFAINEDKFVFDYTAGKSDSGTMLNSCAPVPTSNAEYPQGEMKTPGAAVNIATRLEAPIDVTWGVKINNAYVTSEIGGSQPYKFEPKNGNVQTIASMSNAFLEKYFKKTAPVTYSTTSSVPEKITVFLDSADKKVKAMLTQSTNHASFDFTISKTRTQGKYAVMEYSDFIRQESAGSKITVNATITGYALAGTSLQRIQKSIGPRDFDADGEEHEFSDAIPSGSQFYTISTDAENTKVFFRKGDVLSNMTTDASAKIVAVTPDYSGTSNQIDLVFVADTSRSMLPEWNLLCEKIKDTTAGLTGLGFEVQAKVYPIITSKANILAAMTEAGRQSCNGIDINANGTIWNQNMSGAILSPTPNMGSPENGGYDHNAEAWGPAIQNIVANYAWRQNSNRIVVAVVDNDPTGKRCSDYYEDYNCTQQPLLPALRINSIDDPTPRIENEIDFATKALGAANSVNAKLFFFYGFPINHDAELNNYPSGNPGLNDVFEIYKGTANATGGTAKSFGGDTKEGTRSSGERLFQMISGAILPHSGQKFQLRLETGLEGECMLGEEVGHTGPDSAFVPHIKMNWDWTSIGANACDTTNDEWFYCDQAQFYISLLQKIHQISKWSKDDEIGKNFATVQSYMNFQSYLIEDTYTQQFKADFVNYYQLKTSFNAPSWLSANSPQRWDNYFTGNLFKIKINGKDVTSSQNVPVPAGVYNVAVKFTFLPQPGSWTFFLGNSPVATTEVSLTRAANTPIKDNPFYHLPINGGIGLGQGTGRQNYGTKFNVIGSAIFEISSDALGNKFLVNEITSGKKLVDASMQGSFNELNKTMRGNVLVVEFDSANFSPQGIIFLPGNAEPVFAKMKSKSKKAILDYYAQDSAGTTISGTDYITQWAGVASSIGTCNDFVGNDLPMIPRNDSLIDNLLSGIGDCRENTYGFAWPSLAENDSEHVYLGTVFYTPLQSTFVIKKSCPANKVESRFYALAKTGGTSDIGTKDSALEISNTPYTIGQLGDVFAKAVQGQVCVNISTDTGKMKFWWNPAYLKNALLSKLNITEEDICG